MDEHFPSDDDDDDSDSTAPGIGAGAGGPSRVRRRRDTQRRQEYLHQSRPKIDISVVINLDVANIDIRLYIARLNYTKKLVVSLFDPSPSLVNSNSSNNNNNNEDNTTTTTHPLLSVKDLVEVLRSYRQKIPGELLTLAPPPPLISPSRRLRHRHRCHRGLSDALAVVGGGDNPGEGGGNSENGNEEVEDDYADGDGDGEGDYEDGARMRSTVSSFLRRQQYRNIRNTMVRSHLSSASSDNNGNENKLQSSSRVLLSGRPHYLSPPSQLARPNPVRRLRHAEVVLVDQCLTAYGKTWLRLRWPGELGGFAGFVAVGGGGRIEGDAGGSTVGEGEKVYCHETIDSLAPSSTEAATMTESPQTSSLSCPETNVYYPTSLAMKLLPLYDDGLSVNQIGEDETALLGSLMMDNGEVRDEMRFARTRIFVVSSFLVAFCC